MGTVIDNTGWKPRAAGLVSELVAQGVLDDPALASAFAAIPRHLFTPRVVADDGAVLFAGQRRWLQQAGDHMPLIAADPGRLDLQLDEHLHRLTEDVTVVLPSPRLSRPPTQLIKPASVRRGNAQHLGQAFQRRWGDLRLARLQPGQLRLADAELDGQRGAGHAALVAVAAQPRTQPPAPHGRAPVGEARELDSDDSAAGRSEWSDSELDWP